MTREQFDRLLSSYSSGKISPEEKDILFRASLENQEFFDALADEETLREVMADPACRAELEEILEPQPVLAQAAAAAPMFTRNKQDAAEKEVTQKEPKGVFSFRPWVLALAGTLGSAIIGTFIAWRNQKPAPVLPVPSSGTAVMVAQNDPLKSIPPVPTPSFAPPQAKQQQEKKDESLTALSGKPPEPVPAVAPTIPEDKEKKNEAADTVADARKAEAESVRVQEAPTTITGSAPQHRQRLTSESVRVGSGIGFSALAKREDSIPRFTTKVSDGKITLEVVQEGLLYVLAVDEGNFRIIENGMRVNAGATRIIDPGTSRQLLIAITDKSIDDPNPVRLRVAAPTKIVTIP